MIEPIIKRLKRLSIRHKMALIVMSVSIVILAMIFIAIIVSEWLSMKKNMEENTSTQAMVIGSNSAAALVFDDVKTAKETLSSLSMSPHIVSAALYEKNGRLFAAYMKNNADKIIHLSEPAKEKYYYRADYLTVSENISLDNKVIGTISITTDLQDFYSSLKRHTVYTAVVMTGALLGVILLSILLQRLIITPVLRLNSLMELVSREKNYSLRAEKYSDDEIGSLVDGFNTMLSTIQMHEVELMRSGQLATIGELSAGVAHEINNPINGIINYAQIIANKSEKGSRENDVANRIIKEGNRIAGIVGNLLSLSRQERDEKAIVPVNAILSDSLELTERQLRKDGIKLKLDVPPELPEVIVNPQQIQQVFMNIISNARYALNKKYPEKHEDKVLKIYSEEAAEDDCVYVKVTFHDHGIGIPDNIINRVIDPFFTTKPRGEGTGLGLSISHGIISNHGGKFMIDSREGEFTRVEIALPCNKKSLFFKKG